MPPRPGPTPCRPDGQAAWFTPEHNSFLERLLHFPPGAVLDLYQTHLVQAAQRVLGDHGAAPPPAYDELVAVAVSPRALHARPGRAAGNLEGLGRRGAVRVPEGRRVRQTGEEGGRRSSARTGVPARKPVPAPTGERVQRGRVGDARGDNSGSGNVSSRTRSRSVRRRGSGGRRGSLEEFAYVSRML